jgi:tRNA(fMet)-specific endonuclease VapC
MDAYLLDTNAASSLWDVRHPDHVKIRAFLTKHHTSLIYISVIALAEVEYGLKLSPRMDQNEKDDIRKEMSQLPNILDLDRHTAEPYSILRAKLFSKFAQKDRRGRLKEKRPEELIDHTTGKELGIQENDLWLASLAMQYNLTLVTADNMAHIMEISNSLEDPITIAKWKEK